MHGRDAGSRSGSVRSERPPPWAHNVIAALLAPIHNAVPMIHNAVPILRNEADLDVALVELLAADPRLAPLLARAGRPSLRQRPAGFPGLCAIVCAQQLSTASASAIWERLAGAFDPFHHDTVRRARATKLARIGLSRSKIKTVKAIGVAITKGDIDLDALPAMEVDAAHAALTALHGIGPWTADIYLLFCLGHADAWPAGDLA